MKMCFSNSKMLETLKFISPDSQNTLMAMKSERNDRNE